MGETNCLKDSSAETDRGGVTHITSVNKAVPLMKNKMHTSTCKKKFARNMSNVPNSG